MASPRVVDLFAGCGGLSLGLEAAGLAPVLAVEKSPMAAETHFKNFHLRGQPWDQGLWDHISSASDHIEQAKFGTMVADITQIVEDDKFTEWIGDLEPEVVAGGPPCQGFSMAGRRNPADARNRLPLDFLTVVERAHPRVVLIENVLGMNRAFKKVGGSQPPLAQLHAALEGTGDGYIVQALEVNARHFGVPQNRPRVMLLGVRRDVAKSKSVEAWQAVWRSSDEATGSLIGQFDLTPNVTTAHDEDQISAWSAIGDLGDRNYRFGIDSPQYARYQFAYKMRTDARSDAGRNPLNHTVRNHSEVTTARFALYLALRDRKVSKTIMGIEAASANQADARRRIAEALGGNVEMPQSLRSYIPDGDLVDAVLKLGTKKHSQRAIGKDTPAPTVVTLPDDYIHPTRPRIMTVRELARLQSFPDWFEFRSKETTGSSRRKVEVPQYSQVGNAVPPLLASAVGEVVRCLAE